MAGLQTPRRRWRGPSHVSPLTWVTYTMSAMRAKPSSFSCEMKAWRSTLIWGAEHRGSQCQLGLPRTSTWPQKVLTHGRTEGVSGAECPSLQDSEPNQSSVCSSLGISDV